MKTDANLLTMIAYLLIYLLPTWIALVRRPDYGIIWVLNLWLGWTGIGWIIALIWSIFPNQKRVVFVPDSFRSKRANYIKSRVNEIQESKDWRREP